MKPKQYCLLVVDDDPQHGAVIRELLSQGEFFHPGLIAKRSDGALAIDIVDQVGEALQLIRRGRPRYDVVIADLFMPPPEGGPPRPDYGAEKVYTALAKLPPDRRPLLIVTSNRDNDAQPKVREMLQSAIKDKNRAWVEFVPKPESAPYRSGSGLYSDDNYAWALAHAIAQQRERDWRKGHLTVSPEEWASAGVQLNARFTEAIVEAQRLSDQRLFVVEGEDGTGREQIAARIHSASNRKDFAYVAKACSSLGLDSVKPQLLGWVRGYEGSAKTMPGFLQQCGPGTLFLDDFDFDDTVTSELSRALHGVVRSRHYTPMGSIHEPLPFKGALVLGVTSIAALPTIGPLAELIREIRVSGSVVSLPSLRSCKEDIVPLARFFLAEFSRERTSKRLSREVEDALRNYTWPQNIRELSGLMSYCAHHVAADVIGPSHVERRLHPLVVPRPERSESPVLQLQSSDLRSRGAGNPGVTVDQMIERLLIARHVSDELQRLRNLVFEGENVDSELLRCADRAQFRELHLNNPQTRATIIGLLGDNTRSMSYIQQTSRDATGVKDKRRHDHYRRAVAENHRALVGRLRGEISEVRELIGYGNEVPTARDQYASFLLWRLVPSDEDSWLFDQLSRTEEPECIAQEVYSRFVRARLLEP